MSEKIQSAEEFVLGQFAWFALVSESPPSMLIRRSHVTALVDTPEGPRVSDDRDMRWPRNQVFRSCEEAASACVGYIRALLSPDRAAKGEEAVRCTHPQGLISHDSLPPATYCPVCSKQWLGGPSEEPK